MPNVERTAQNAHLSDKQRALLGALLEFVRICERHNLRYTLYCGTLLGAIRHKGFIPWDEDADVAMPLKDYWKFVSIAAAELPDGYVFQGPGDRWMQYWLWSKIGVWDMPVHPEEFARMDLSDIPVAEKCVSIDIYPFVGVAESPILYRAQLLLCRASRYLRRPEYWKLFGYSGHPRKRILQRAVSLLPYPLRRGLSLLLVRLAMRDPEHSNHICTFDAAPFVPKYGAGEWREFTQAEFEGHMFAIPREYDTLLRRMYGDYMQLPPVQWRVGRRSILLRLDREA